MRLHTIERPVFNDRAEFYIGSSIVAYFISGAVFLIGMIFKTIPLMVVGIVVSTASVYAVLVLVLYFLQIWWHKGEQAHYNRMLDLRQIDVDEFEWLRSEEIDCTVYHLQHNGYMSGYHVVRFNNKTDEMLFTIARGQEK